MLRSVYSWFALPQAAPVVVVAAIVAERLQRVRRFISELIAQPIQSTTYKAKQS